MVCRGPFLSVYSLQPGPELQHGTLKTVSPSTLYSTVVLKPAFCRQRQIVPAAMGRYHPRLQSERVRRRPDGERHVPVEWAGSLHSNGTGLG